MAEPGINQSVQIMMFRDIFEDDGPRIAIISLKCIISIVGSVGNGIVIYVLLSTMRKSKVDTTKWLILNLAICDLFDVAIYEPIRIYDMMNPFTRQGKGSVSEGMCKTVSFITQTFAAVGLLTVAAISLVRYLLICHPLKARRCLTWKNTVVGIVGIWIIAALTILPFPLHFTYVAKVHLWGGDMDVCLTELFGEESIDWMVYYTLIFIFYFLLPVISLMYFYTVIFRQFHANENHLHDTKMAKAMKARRSLAKLLLFIAILFVLLHTPLFLLFLAMTFGAELKSNPVFTIVCIETLSTANAALNPYIYCAQSRSFFRKRMFKFLSTVDTSVGTENSPSVARKTGTEDGIIPSIKLSSLGGSDQQESAV